MRLMIWRISGVIGVLLVLWAATAIWLLATAWTRVPAFEPATMPAAAGAIMPRSEYGLVIDTHPRPYVYELDIGPGAVLMFGSEHTRTPEDPQLATLRDEWRRFDPTVLLVEGTLGRLLPAFHDPVRMFGEMGAAHELSREHRVPTYTWEPPAEVRLAALVEQGFTEEQIGLRLILGSYFSNLRHGRPASPEAFVGDTLKARAAEAGATARFASIDRVDDEWRRHFPDGPDWRDVSDQFGLPGFLGSMDTNAARDRHLVAIVAELTSRGERVLVVAGCSHAVVIEPALHALQRPD